MSHRALSPAQFVAPGEMREIDGKSYEFRGWHLSNQRDLSVNPEHQHWENAGSAGAGGVYATHDPMYWYDYRPAKYAHQVWAQADEPSQRHEHPTRGYFNLDGHESVTSSARVQIGETHDAEDVINESVTGRVVTENKTLQNLMAGPKMPRSYKMRAVK